MVINKLVILAAALMAATIQAQEMPTAPHLNFNQRSAFLLTNPNCGAKLALDKPQQQKITAVIQGHALTQKKLYASASPDEAALTRNDQSFADKVLAVLKPAQATKLFGLALVDIGPTVLAETEVAKRFKLTKAQSSTIGAVAKQVEDREQKYKEMVMMGLAELAPPKTQADTAAFKLKQAEVIKSYDTEKKSMSSDVKDLEAKILATLNSAQLTQWKSLTGA